MLRQYYTSPFQGGDNPLRVGTIAAGTIFRIPRSLRNAQARADASASEPYIVESFLNGTYAAACRNPVTGHWEDRTISGRSDLAILRSLACGARMTCSVSWLRALEDAGAAPDSRYPSLPDVARYHGAWRREPRACIAA